jgi:hypothetical protein
MYVLVPSLSSWVGWRHQLGGTVQAKFGPSTWHVWIWVQVSPGTRGLAGWLENGRFFGTSYSGGCAFGSWICGWWYRHFATSEVCFSFGRGFH